MVAGLGKRPLFSDPTPGAAELESFLSLPRARVRPVPVAENAGPPQCRDPLESLQKSPHGSRVTGCLRTPRTEVIPPERCGTFCLKTGTGRGAGHSRPKALAPTAEVRTPSGGILGVLLRAASLSTGLASVPGGMEGLAWNRPLCLGGWPWARLSENMEARGRAERRERAQGQPGGTKPLGGGTHNTEASACKTGETSLRAAGVKVRSVQFR